MTVRTLYSTRRVMEADPANLPPFPRLNEHGSAVAFGKGSDGRYCFSVMGPDGAGMAIFDRDELVMIHDAIVRELANA